MEIPHSSLTIPLAETLIFHIFFLSKSLGNSFQSPLPYVSQNITDKIYIYYHLTIFALLGKDPQMTHSKLVTYHSVLYGLSI